jgi:ABC-2 type transport system permease protein
MRARQLLDTVGLADAADREVAGYSKGMKRKLTIAAGIIHQPPVLFLDEPTSGIDVASARRIRQLIADLHRSGTTIVPTIQPTQEWYGMMLSVSRCPADLLAALASAFPALTIHPDAQSARIRIESSHPSRVGPLVHFFEEQGIEITEARRIQPSLEEEFVRLTGIDADALRREKDKPGGERMSRWIAPWNILIKDMRAYHRKPPNISWGLIFPIAWTAMFFIRSGGAPEDLHLLLPGVVAISILFGTTSLLSVTGTFETRKRAFERLLLAPIRLELLMLAKTSGAILFGVANAVVPILLALFLTDLSQVSWAAAAPPIVLIAIVSTFLGLSIAVSVSEVFEAQTFSNFFRFPMIFLCGLLFPIERLPSFLRPLSYLLPLTCGADKLHGAFRAGNTMPMLLDFTILAAFCVGLFALSVRNVQRRWIA